MPANTSAMLSRERIQEVVRLIADGKSFREINRLTGVSYGTINKIKKGYRGADEPESPSSMTTSTDSNVSNIEYISKGIKSEDEAIRECKVDLTRWYVDRFDCTTWTTPMKLRDGEGPEKPAIVQNYRVSLRLKRIQTKTQQAAFDAVFELMKKHSPKYPPLKRDRSASEREMAVFCLFDVHFGKLAWAPETQSNYDLKIADQLYRNAVDDLAVKASHRNIVKVVMPVGNDFFHVDNLRNETTAGTPQDADGRYAKIIETGELAVIWAVERLRQIAPVEVIWIPGNHDVQTSYHLARTLWAWFSKCQDVKVDIGPSYRKYARWGTNLIGFTHGNEEKHDSLPMLMANERPLDHAETTCREWLIGHQHQSKAYFTKGIETRSGTVVRVVQSLAGTDGWHHRKGYNNCGRAAECFFYGENSGQAGWVPFNVRR